MEPHAPRGRAVQSAHPHWPSRSRTRFPFLRKLQNKLGVGVVAGVVVLGGFAALAAAAAVPLVSPSHKAPVTHVAVSAPKLTVRGKTLTWTKIDRAELYVVAIVLPRVPVSYQVVRGTRFTPRAHPGQTIRYRVRANLRGAKSSKAVAIKYARQIHATMSVANVAPVLSNVAPVLSVAGGKISWAAQAGATGYGSAISTAAVGGTTVYQTLGQVTSWTPVPQPGKTLYYGVASQGSAGDQWSAPVAITWPVANTMPVLSVAGGKISWAAQAGATGYGSAISTAAVGGTTVYQTLGQVTSWTPVPQPGKTLYYGVASQGSAGDQWSAPVAITWPVANTMPVLSVAGGKISWAAQAGATGYGSAISTAAVGGTTVYQTLGQVTSWTPVPQPGKTLYYGIASQGSAGDQWSAPVAITWPVANTMPVLSVSNGTISWAAQAGATGYGSAISTAAVGGTTVYQTLGQVTSWTPVPQPGKTLYYGIASQGSAGDQWSAPVAITWPVANTMPVLSVSNGTISWAAQAGATGFAGAVSTAPAGTAGRTTSNQDLGNVTTWTPTPQPGQTLYYGVASQGPAGDQWASQEVSITWPAAASNTAPVLSVSNGAISWPAQPGATSFSGHTRPPRAEAPSPTTRTSPARGRRPPYAAKPCTTTWRPKAPRASNGAARESRSRGRRAAAGR